MTGQNTIERENTRSHSYHSVIENRPLDAVKRAAILSLPLSEPIRSKPFIASPLASFDSLNSVAKAASQTQLVVHNMPKSITRSEKLSSPLCSCPQKEDIVEWASQKNEAMSQMLGKEVPNFDFFLIFLLLQKLSIKDREQFMRSRREERKEQILQMLKVVESLKEQANWLQGAGFMSGLAYIAAGILPIIGLTAGDSIIGTLSKLFSAFEGMNSTKAFNALAKIAEAVGKMQEIHGQSQKIFSESDQHRYQVKEQIAQSMSDEHLDHARQALESFKEIARALQELLNMEYQSERSSFFML